MRVTGKYHEKQFPGEGETYRAARDVLLTAETELRRQIEEAGGVRAAFPWAKRLPFKV